MAKGNRTRGAKKAAAAKRGHKNAGKRKSHRGVKVAAWSRWGSRKRKLKK